MARRQEPRMGFGEIFDKVAWSLICAVALYAANQLKEMSASVSQLNVNVSVLVERVTNQEKIQNELKYKLDALDMRVIQVEKSRLEESPE